jgi:hypothetical protein
MTAFTPVPKNEKYWAKRAKTACPTGSLAAISI